MADFYGRVLPSTGPFTVLTGVTGPDGKLSEQRHWNGLKTHREVEDLVQRQSQLPVNVFYAVGSYAGKNRKDPTAKRCFYLDLDSKDFGTIPDALRALVAFVKATGLPPPSIFVHSGRGVHVYWALDRDVTIDEWTPVAKALKAKCKELDFPADPTATADPARILRCPGTLNRKGAEPLACRVLSDNGQTVALDAMAAALRVESAPASTASKLAALVGQDDLSTKREFSKLSEDDLRDMLDFIQLPPGGTSECRDEWITILCCIQDWGNKSPESFEIFHDWSSGQPEYVNRADCLKTWNSFNPGGGFTVGTLIKKATEAGWAPAQPIDPVLPVPAGTSLAQTLATPSAASTATPGVQQGVIASKLMLAADHAAKALGKPRFELNDAVHWLANEFVLVGDQEGIFYSITNRMPMASRVIDDMLTRYMPLNANGIPINATAIMRRYGTVHAVNSLGFHPGASSVYMENGLSYVNQYLAPEQLVPMSPTEIKLIEHFWWQYLFPREEDRPFGEYLMGCYGHLVQRPDVKIASAPVMVSKEFGTGKTTVMYDIPRALAGVHVSKLVSNKVLRSTFSDYINGTHFVHFDEVHINGKWDSDDTANSLKNLITGKMVEVHPKGMKTFNIPNRLFITATSNYEDAISLPSDDERRWGVYYLNPPPFPTLGQKAAYFRAIHALITSPSGPGKLRWYFSQVDLSGFDPQAAPPLTAAKRKMIQRSQVFEVQILKEWADNAAGPFVNDVFLTEAVRQALQSETGKTYSGVQVREFVVRAVPDACALKQIRSSMALLRPWVWRNHAQWANASNDEIRQGLKIAQ